MALHFYMLSFHAPGSQMHIDHPGESESQSPRDLPESCCRLERSQRTPSPILQPSDEPYLGFMFSVARIPNVMIHKCILFVIYT